jgi:hypothetical protein
MTTRTFTITLDDADRLAVLTALGFAQMITPVKLRRPVTELIDRLSAANGQDAPADPLRSGTEAARAVLSPPPAASPVPTTMDYFQRDKKGNLQMSAPDGAELSQVKIVSATKFAKAGKAPYMQVLFAAGVTFDGRVRPAGKANCFDPDLWNPIKNREGQVASLWIAESGSYLNIVGVRA